MLYLVTDAITTASIIIIIIITPPPLNHTSLLEVLADIVLKMNCEVEK
jgi:hypothetical protein